VFLVRRLAAFLLPLLCLLLPGISQAQQSKMFGPFELHYSVVNTTFLSPEVASAYGITRGEKRAILNLAVREHTGDTSQARPMRLRGSSRDLVQRQQELEFQEIRESGAIYYIAEFKFLNEEWLVFEIDFRPMGAEQTYSFKFKHQLYVN
jgi:hypothetical protein